MAKVKEVSAPQFEREVLRADIPVLVDFWGPSCGACRRIAPILEELAEEYSDKVKFLSINTADNTNTARDYHIWAIPALIVFKGGREVGQVIGFRSKGDLKDFIEQVLGWQIVEPEKDRTARLLKQREIIRRHRRRA